MLCNIFFKEIINKINAVPISLTNIEDKLTWKLTTTSELQLNQCINGKSLHQVRPIAGKQNKAIAT